MNALLRSATVLALLAAAIAASAQVSYSFNATYFNSTGTVLTSAPVTSTTTFTQGVSGSDGHGNATSFRITVNGSTFNLQITYDDSSASGLSYIPVSYLTNSGVYDNGSGTFTSVVPTPTPEPSALAALGLGAVAFVKRRKK